MTHRRRWSADPLAMFKLVSKVTPYSEDDVVQLALPSRMAFEHIKNGTGEEDHFNELAVCINSTLVMAEQIDPLCVETCKQGQAALQRAKDRYLQIGRWGWDGPALQQIPAALDLHEEVMRNSNPYVMTEALKTQYQRIEKQKQGVFAL